MSIPHYVETSSVNRENPVVMEKTPRLTVNGSTVAKGRQNLPSILRSSLYELSWTGR